MVYDNRYVRAWFTPIPAASQPSERDLDYQEEEPPLQKSVKLPDNEYVPEDVKAWEAVL